MAAQPSDKTVVIGEEALTLGFRLAGVSEWYTVQGEEAAKKLGELLKREEVGIIIASELHQKGTWIGGSKMQWNHLPNRSWSLSPAKGVRQKARKSLYKSS